MPDTQSADLVQLVSREQAENAFRAALSMFVGRGRRHSITEVSVATGVPKRILECYKSYAFGHPDHRPLDFGQRLSLIAYIGADLTTELLKMVGQAAYNLPDDEPDPGELAADASENTARVVRMAADRDFSNDSPHELKAAGSKLIDAGMKLVATGCEGPPGDSLSPHLSHLFYHSPDCCRGGGGDAVSWPIPEDMLNERRMERGSADLLQAIEAARAGRDPRTRANLIWSMSEGGWDSVPGSRSSAHLYGEPRSFEKDRHAESLKALRDPCPKCGTRMDIGCAHVKHIFTANQTLTDPVHVDRAWDRTIREARRQAGDEDVEAFR